jgi:hypothetical protein
MPPFQYDPYRTDSAGTIGEFLRDSARAQARAGELSAQGWSGAIQNIGQVIGGLPAQIQRQEAGAQQLELGHLQVKEAQAVDRSRTIFEAR